LCYPGRIVKNVLEDGATEPNARNRSAAGAQALRKGLS
jgi:hypothetical protein